MPILTIIAGLWQNQWARLGIAIVLAGGLGFVKGFNSVPRVDVAAVQRNAEAGRDAVWQSKLAEQEREANEKLAGAIAARDTVEPIANAPNWADELCKRSATCRNHGRSK